MNVYDFDNTIYDGESFVDCFFFYLKRDPTILRYAPYMISGVTKYRLGTIELESGMAQYAHFVEEFIRSVDDFRADAVEFWDNHMHRIKPFYKEVQRGDDVIISASPEVFLEEVCRRLNIKSVIGSTFDKDTGKITRMCFSQNKVPAFYERYPDGKIENLYTDSMHDLPLMNISEHVFFVEGNKITKIK